MPNAATTARRRAHEEISREILRAARARLRTEGPAQLSLRAVARDVGMVSSAVYRYVASRDELLTALLIEAYDELGRAAEEADAAVTPRADLRGRWFAACRAVRGWALAHPGDYALLYGSPVPGYAAPPSTVEPAGRVVFTLLATVVAAHGGPLERPAHPVTEARGDPVDTDDTGEADDADDTDAVAGAVRFARAQGLPLDGRAASAVMARMLMAWTTLFGTVSFELFGHFVGSVDDAECYFDLVVGRLADDIGLPGETGGAADDAAPEGGTAFWEARYGEAAHIWSGEPNAALVTIAEPLAPGRALDLGSGEGGDAIWLASRGWRVTGIDISGTAAERAARAAEHAGVADRITWRTQDLADWRPTPGESYDLVSACFLHSPVAGFPRDAVLARAADAVAPGGALLIVGHAGGPPWKTEDEAEHAHHRHDFPDVDAQLAALALETTAWTTEIAETRERNARGPDGQEAVLTDTVVLLRRRV